MRALRAGGNQAENGGRALRRGESTRGVVRQARKTRSASQATKRGLNLAPRQSARGVWGPPARAFLAHPPHGRATGPTLLPRPKLPHVGRGVGLRRRPTPLPLRRAGLAQILPQPVGLRAAEEQVHAVHVRPPLGIGPAGVPRGQIAPGVAEAGCRAAGPVGQGNVRQALASRPR
jgi:hypothetical protein